jgi:pyridoxal 5'-phosphate synthase pdxT subunit
MPKVGVVAIQGDFEKHIESLVRCGVAPEQIVELRAGEDLSGVNRVIIPGGESTTVGLLMQRYGLGEALQAAAENGMPIWGTCMGMILMARSVVGRSQYTLNLLDIEVERNAFGAQVHSFEDSVLVEGIGAPVTGVFIRAPIVTDPGSAVPIARYQGKIVAVLQGKCLGTSFHPELTDDTQLHEFFLRL